MFQAAERWDLEIVGWTLLEHHYHGIVNTQGRRSLPRFLGRLHTRTAIQVNREDNQPGRQIWRQYWDTLLRSEGDFWCRLNYIWWNPLKHGFCASPEEWRGPNLATVMADADEEARRKLSRFPDPQKLPGDEW